MKLFGPSNAMVAVIDKDGVVTGLAKGTATITATDGSGKKATVKINVAYLVKTVEISGPSELAAGKSIQLTAVVSPADATNKKVVWTSSDAAVATVSTSGKVTAKKVAGTQEVTITATATDGSGVFGEYHVTVSPMGTTGTLLVED